MEEEYEVCEQCGGIGTVSTDERDNDGNWQRGVGTEICYDCRPEPDYDDQDE